MTTSVPQLRSGRSLGRTLAALARSAPASRPSMPTNRLTPIPEDKVGAAVDAAFAPARAVASWSQGLIALAARRLELRIAHRKASLDYAAAHLPSKPDADPHPGDTSAELKRVVATRAALDDHTRLEREFAETTLKPEPIARAVELKGKMPVTEEHTSTSDNGVTVAGSIMVGMVQTGAAAGIAGEVLATVPLAPGLMPATRLLAFAKLYDLYRIKRAFLEYIPAVATTEPGIIAGAAYSDVQDSASVSLFGASLVGDVLTRAGSEGWSVYSSAGIDVQFPQQAWYYCANPEVPNLMVAGLAQIITVTAPAVSKTYALLRLHYEIEFMNASSARLGASPYAQYSNLTMNFAGLTETVNNPFFITKAAITGATIPSFMRGAIYTGTIVATADGANGTNWRSVAYAEYQENLSLQAGVHVYFRTGANNTNVIFYPSYGSCMAAEAASDLNGMQDVFYNNFTTVLAGTATFTVDDVQEWLMPEN